MRIAEKMFNVMGLKFKLVCVQVAEARGVEAHSFKFNV